MIVSHLDGLEEIYKLRNNFELEIECVCLNSNYSDISQYLIKAKCLKSEFPDIVVFKESEDHWEDTPYYELSIFCNNNELEKYQNKLESLGISIDIIHENKDLWSPS